MCADCNEYYLKDDCIRITGHGYVCEYCSENYVECTECDCMVHVDDHTESNDMCDRCFNVNYFYCTECDDVCNVTDSFLSSGDKYCTGCASELELVKDEVTRFGRFGVGDIVRIPYHGAVEVVATAYNDRGISSNILVQLSTGDGHSGRNHYLDDGRFSTNCNFRDVYWVYDDSSDNSDVTMVRQADSENENVRVGTFTEIMRMPDPYINDGTVIGYTRIY